MVGWREGRSFLVAKGREVGKRRVRYSRRGVGGATSAFQRPSPQCGGKPHSGLACISSMISNYPVIERGVGVGIVIYE